MWKTIFIFISLIALSFNILADAANAPLMDARAKLLSGDFDTAIMMGEDMGTAEGLSLVAESLSAKVMLGYTDEPKDTAKRARKIATKALELDETSHEANVQYALAYGFETQASSPFRAWRKKLPQKTFKAIAAVREKFPEDPRGDALLGAWHLGIVRKAGAKRGEKMFDASEEAGILHYEAALERAPKDMIILGNYMAVLLTIDAGRHLERVQPLLMKLRDCPANNAVEAEVKKRLANFHVHSDNPEELMKLAELLLDGQKTY